MKLVNIRYFEAGSDVPAVVNCVKAGEGKCDGFPLSRFLIFVKNDLIKNKNLCYVVISVDDDAYVLKVDRYTAPVTGETFNILGSIPLNYEDMGFISSYYVYLSQLADDDFEGSKKTLNHLRIKEDVIMNEALGDALWWLSYQIKKGTC